MTPHALLQHYDSGALWPAGHGVAAEGGVADGYQQAFAVRALREQRGEKVVGYKIGFTNRTIWERYAVFAPIWGPVYDRTITFCDGAGSISLAGTSLPRLEPECVFGMRATPPRDTTLEQLFDCVDWFAPGFEVVQSHLDGWKFTAAQTVTDQALHARLLVGPKTPVREVAAQGEAFDAVLARARIRLYHGAELKDEGVGANVLDGPLHALLHFVLEMQRIPGAPSLRPGDVITTGTWTDAWPLAPGQTWRAEFEPPMRPLEITLR